MGRPWWDTDRRNPFRRETEEERALEDAIFGGFFRWVLALVLIFTAGLDPDEDWEWSSMVCLCFLALLAYDFRKGAVIWLLPWLVFAGLSQPVWIPDLSTWAWQMLAYVAAGLVLLSWALPFYVGKRALRQQSRADARLKAQSAPPTPATRQRPHQARPTYPQGHPQHPDTRPDGGDLPPNS